MRVTKNKKPSQIYQLGFLAVKNCVYLGTFNHQPKIDQIMQLVII